MQHWSFTKKSWEKALNTPACMEPIKKINRVIHKSPMFLLEELFIDNGYPVIDTFRVYEIYKEIYNGVSFAQTIETDYKDDFSGARDHLLFSLKGCGFFSLKVAARSRRRRRRSYVTRTSQRPTFTPFPNPESDENEEAEPEFFEFVSDLPNPVYNEVYSASRSWDDYVSMFGVEPIEGVR